MRSEWRMYEFELELDEPDRVYFSGDEITGQVLVHIGSCLAVQGIYKKVNFV